MTYEEPKQLTVGELVNLLEDEMLALPVVLEGCDCHGDCAAVKVVEGSNGAYLLLQRLDCL